MRHRGGVGHCHKHTKPEVVLYMSQMLSRSICMHTYTIQTFVYTVSVFLNNHGTHDILVFFLFPMWIKRIFLMLPPSVQLAGSAVRFLSEGALAVEDETFHRFVEANWQEDSGWMGAG